MTSLQISPLAQKDLLEIKVYISEELASPATANSTLLMIVKRIRELEAFPQVGAPLSSIIEFETDYRFLVCGHYITFYRYENDVVYVDRVLYGKRDFMKILFGDNEAS